LVVESIFTVDDTELMPYINEYAPDDFEKYLARLFVGANYSGVIDNATELAYNINEVYESFIDTVDSVNKRPNPKARTEEWIPSYDEDPQKIGPHTDGNVMLGEDILTSIVVGNVYVVAGKKGKIASCYLDNQLCRWTPCDSETPKFEGAIWSNGNECDNEDITSCIMYHDYIIFGTAEGHLFAYDVRHETWHNKDDIPFLNIENTWVENTRINGFLIDQVEDTLYMYGDNGTIDGFFWDDQIWCGTSYEEYKNTTKLSVGTTGVMGNIYAAFIINSTPYRTLIITGENGEVCSCYVNCDQDNCWRKPDSSSHLGLNGIRPNVFSDGEYRNYSTVRAVCEYFGYKIFVGDEGVVTYLDNTFFITSDPLKICNNGSHFNNLRVNDCISYNEKLMIFGGEAGKVSEYEGESQSWYNCDAGLGELTSNGLYMEGCEIYTMQLVSKNGVNYIIFAGEAGKVSSFNINIAKSPYRYKPFKSSFLEWYTTPGNAVIETEYTIPEEIAKKFDMLIEANTEDGGSICIRGGDDDLMVDVDMNDNGSYPWNLKDRRKFIAQFIEELPDGSYTLDEIYEAFMSSKYCHMLYEQDLPCLRGGDDLDGDDIDITD
jgi:hypothetical protein